MKREFLMQAHKYEGQDISGWWVSNKLDGMRAFWDGGTSRGLRARDVPYANVKKDKHDIIATGLWSRLGKVIHAPDWWLGSLPNFCLDGELISGTRQVTLSDVKNGQSDWKNVEYHIFDLPHPENAFLPFSFWERKDVTNYQWFYNRGVATVPLPLSSSYEGVYRFLNNIIRPVAYTESHESFVLRVVPQYPIERSVKSYLDEAIVAGYEGVVLRSPWSNWLPVRSKNLLKWKPFYDMEAKVLAIVPGEGKYTGMMGALQVSAAGKIFCVGSGFTDPERMLLENGASMHFPLGTIISIKYGRLSDTGVPIEPRYWRKRCD